MAAAPSEARSVRSAGSTRARWPAFSMMAAGSLRLPGSGVVSGRAPRGGCARSSLGPAAAAVVAVVDELGGRADTAEAEGFQPLEGDDREAVVQLGHVDVGRAEVGARPELLGRVPGRRLRLLR